MLSKKLTFSLTSLIVLLALSFAFAPTALAHELKKDGKDVAHKHAGPVPRAELSTVDVSAAPGYQAQVFNAIGSPGGPGGSARILPIIPGSDPGPIDTQAKIDTLIAQSKIAAANGGGVTSFIRLYQGVASLDSRGANIRNGTGTAGTDVPSGLVLANPRIRDFDLHILDIGVTYYDEQGIEIPLSPTAADAGYLTHADTKITHRNTAFPDGRNFMVYIHPDNIPDRARFMTLTLGEEAFRHADPADVNTALTTGAYLHLSASGKIDGNADGDIADAEDITGLTLVLTNAEPAPLNVPRVVSVVRVVPTAAQATSRFVGTTVSGPFDVRVTFTEEPNFLKENNKAELKAPADIPIKVTGGKLASYYKGEPSYLKPSHFEGNYTNAAAVPAPTGRDARYHPYLLRIEPDLTTPGDVVIRVHGFQDLVLPPNSFSPPNNLALEVNRSVLRVTKAGVKTVATSIEEATKANRDNRRSNEIFVLGRQIIPAKGYLVLARGANAAVSGVKSVGAAKYKDNDKRERADNQTDIDFKYNINYNVTFPVPGDNFEVFFQNGGTIELRYQDAPKNTVVKAGNKSGYHGSRTNEGIARGSVIINEIMWGTDATATDKQWIELYNPGDTDLSLDENEWVLRFSGQTPVIDSKFETVVDVAGNNPYWPVVGQSGVSTVTQTHPTLVALISMSRLTDTADGTVAASWAASIRPSVNLTGLRIGTPGAANNYAEAPPAPVEPPPPVAPVPVATGADIRVTEVMVSSNDGRLPQWIELKNISATEKSLAGWGITVDNDPSDSDVVGARVNVQLGNVTVGENEVVLVVTKTGRNSGVGTGTGDLREDRIVNVQSQVSPKDARYSLISEMAFRLSLLPPQTSGVVEPGDVVGNLGMAWELPMAEGNDRSSIIRRQMGEGKSEIKGTDAAGWRLASDTNLDGAYRTTYYGNDEDRGTPGYDGGGPLPVELSKFNAARDRLTGTVVITWETQSELNNAGFFIKRSQQKNGQFKVVNPTMIQGAGTTSEKQSYTYTDTTAQPNIVYYYQIEDVSLDGHRQTLTRGHRLKGHIGAAGKATTTWGDLKTSREQ